MLAGHHLFCEVTSPLRGLGRARAGLGLSLTIFTDKLSGGPSCLISPTLVYVICKMEMVVVPPDTLLCGLNVAMYVGLAGQWLPYGKSPRITWHECVSLIWKANLPPISMASPWKWGTTSHSGFSWVGLLPAGAQTSKLQPPNLQTGCQWPRKPPRGQ